MRVSEIVVESVFGGPHLFLLPEVFEAEGISEVLLKIFPLLCEFIWEHVWSKKAVAILVCKDDSCWLDFSTAWLREDAILDAIRIASAAAAAAIAAALVDGKGDTPFSNGLTANAADTGRLVELTATSSVSFKSFDNIYERILVYRRHHCYQ